MHDIKIESQWPRMILGMLCPSVFHASETTQGAKNHANTIQKGFQVVQEIPPNDPTGPHDGPMRTP
eukprot:6954533-Pyramimonas_sp.AAC.1